MSATMTPLNVPRDKETGRVLLTKRERDGLRRQLAREDDLERRGEIKTLLGIKRTGAETIAYARQLLDTGLMLSVVARLLEVEARYLRRLLDKARDTEKRPSIPLSIRRIWH